MNKKKIPGDGIWKSALRASISAVLALALLTPGADARSRRGANIVVTKNDGGRIQGELLAVKGTDLIIRYESNSTGVTVNLEDVELVKVKKKNGLAITLASVVVGGVAGGVIGYSLGAGDRTEFLWELGAGMGEILGAGCGAGLGVAVGIPLGAAKKIKPAGRDPQSVSRAAARLRPLARDPS